MNLKMCLLEIGVDESQPFFYIVGINKRNNNMAQHITFKDVQDYFYEKFARRRGPLLGYYPNLFEGIRIDSGFFFFCKDPFRNRQYRP